MRLSSEICADILLTAFCAASRLRISRNGYSSERTNESFRGLAFGRGPEMATEQAARTTTAVTQARTKTPKREQSTLSDEEIRAMIGRLEAKLASDLDRLYRQEGSRVKGVSILT